jgi:hypothetical protein
VAPQARFLLVAVAARALSVEIAVLVAPVQMVA